MPVYRKRSLRKKRLWNSGHIEFKEGTPFRRYFEDEEGAEHDPFYCFMESEWSSTSEAGKAELNSLLGEFHGFDTVKPTTLLRTLTLACTTNNDIILDFFSGSATTAHAVMSLNSETMMNRRFIMIQIPEACLTSSKIDGIPVETICDIGEERIRRAGKKIKVHATRLYSGSGKPGELLSVKPLVIACAEGAVEFVEVQPEGKKRMSAEAFAAGYLRKETP